jgi:hypothetical protein
VTPAVAPGDAEVAPDPERDRSRKVGDPFFDPPAEPSKDVTARRDTAPQGEAAPAKRADTPSKAAPKAEATPKAKPDAKRRAGPTTARPRAATGTYYRTALRLGTAADARTRPATRLTPIGDRHDPAALYLGVMRGASPYAVFVLGRRSTSRGEGRCAAGTRCRTIGLRSGDTQVVTVRDFAGHALRRITLHVGSVQAVRTTVARARTLRAKVHPYGRTAMREMWRSPAVAAVLGELAYDRGSGLVVSTPPTQAPEQATG